MKRHSTKKPVTQGDPPPDSPDDLVAHPWKAKPRARLLRILETMPSEAFGWLVVPLAQGIWPDGLGGFQPESRVAIEAVRAEAAAILEGGNTEV